MGTAVGLDEIPAETQPWSVGTAATGSWHGKTGTGCIVASGRGAVRSMSGLLGGTGGSGPSPVRLEVALAGAASSIIMGMSCGLADKSARNVSTGGPTSLPAGAGVGAADAAKTRTGVSRIGISVRRVIDGLLERGARVGTGRAMDALAIS
jgi:hypothetical protein